jgi:hypothetical protein
VSDDIGDLRTQRPLPNPVLEQLDPFLFLNHHGPQVYPPGNSGLPFGPHPHRGFETVTFIVDGPLLHRDTGGHESVIGPGGVQWMTAGRGLEHAALSPEEFLRDGGPLEILQLWINLPSRLKMTEPRYVGLQREEIPAFQSEEGGANIHLISGDLLGHTGPIHSLTDVRMMTIDFTSGGHASIAVEPGRTVFLYIVRGEVKIGDETIGEMNLVELNDDGDTVSMEATTNSLVLFGDAVPFGEPVASYGPFVMNTREEIVQAIRDYERGMFR